MQYVIVGGSIAAASGLAAVRKNNPHAQIRVVADEPVPFYYRPLIPYLLDGSRTAEEILFTQHPAATGEAEMLHDQCLGIDSEKRLLRLKSGKELAYGKLLVAAGGVPLLLLPDLAGVASEGVFTLRSMEDAIQIRKYLLGCKTAAVIGGGLVGIKAAEALQRAGLGVTVIEQQKQILPLRADGVAAEAIAERLMARGVTILNEESPTEIIASTGKAEGVRLVSGKNKP
ncbi:MAG: NAD(P)/FAD-dependent oxidoreductase, partial [Candidatus Electrothrix sp. AR3]|nr:NAD(P)/FAD-dependent oxidoreductase [Candidatus Electrothrix sp. AR3]